MDAATTRAKAGATNEPVRQRRRGTELAVDDGTRDADPASPPCVIRGANCPPPSESCPEAGVYLTLDWVRVCGTDGLIQSARQFLTAKFGDPEAREGLYFCKAGEVYPGGVRLLWEHPSQVCIVDAPGSALASMTAAERVEFVRDLLRLGFHGTRIDLAGDFVGQGLALYENALASCKADELCGARRFNPVESRTAHEWKGRTLYLGLRGGNGSGRYVRIYDKGLETETAAVGEWERFEVEFTDKPARMVAQFMAQADDWADMHRKLMLGAVEFRVNTGDAHKDRRPLSEWWAAMVQAVNTIRHAASRPLAEFRRWKKWVGRCVVPTLEAMAAKMNIGFDTLCYELADLKREAKEAEIGSVIDQAAKLWERHKTLRSTIDEHYDHNRRRFPADHPDHGHAIQRFPSIADALHAGPLPQIV